MKKILYVLIILIFSSSMAACNDNPYVGKYESTDNAIIKLNKNNNCTIINTLYKEAFYTNGKYILKDKFLPYYKIWMEERNSILEKNKKSHNLLFIKDNGEPATGGTIRSWVVSIENYLGVNFYPHSLRHFLVTELSKKNIPPALIKDLVGWSSLEMVNLYDDTESRDKVWSELDNLK